MEKMMHWTRLLALFVLLSLMLAALAACSGASVPQSSSATMVPAASSSAPTAGTAAPNVASAPTGVSVPTTAAAPTTQQSAFTDHPDGIKQVRLRLAHFVFGGPNVDLFV